MDISKTVKVVQRAITSNSPAILTGMAVAGVITTVVMAVRATPKALDDLDDERDVIALEVPDRDDYEDIMFSRMDVVKLTWKRYIPTAAFGFTTIACIIGANSISSRKTAALISLYSVTETALKEYQSKVVETLGEKADQKIRDGVAKDRLEKDPPSSAQVHITGMGEQLCYDTLSGRYFKGDIEIIRKAQNDINAEVINSGYASQNDFYQLIGLESNEFGELAGWRTDNMMELAFTSHLATDGRPCLSVGYLLQPVLKYYKLG